MSFTTGANLCDIRSMLGVDESSTQNHVTLSSGVASQQKILL